MRWREGSEVSCGFGNYRMVYFARAISVDQDDKKSGFKCRGKSKNERTCQMSPLCPSRSMLYPLPLCSLSQINGNINRILLSDSIEFGQLWAPGGDWREGGMGWGYIFPQLPTYGAFCIHSTKGHSSLQLGSGNHLLLAPLRPHSHGNRSALLVLVLSTTLSFPYILPAHFYTSPLLTFHKPSWLEHTICILLEPWMLQRGSLAGKSEEREIRKHKAGFVMDLIL